jgi:FixJ family two-component response regulator
VACANNALADDSKIWLHARRYKDLDPRTPVEAPIMTKRLTVAIVDDDFAILIAVKKFLSVHGYETELYPSARAFLDAAPRSVATRFLIDIQLGDSCGFDLARELADLGINYPIIFMTGNSNEIHEKRAREVGCAAFLSKPYAPHLLIEALVQLERMH